MTTRRAWLLFWGALLLCWPVPMFGLEGSFVPVARYLQLALAMSALAITEGTQGMVGLFMGLLWGHVLFWAGVLFAVAFALSGWGLARVEDAARRAWTAAVLALILLWGVFVVEYDTQFHHTDAHASFWTIYR